MHARIAIYDIEEGRSDEAKEAAKDGMLPIFREQPGFGSYSVVIGDDGTLISISTWESSDAADAAQTVAAGFVAETSPGLITLRESHVGTVAF
jgi:heme-degrading monooxygenase HmoA